MLNQCQRSRQHQCRTHLHLTRSKKQYRYEIKQKPRMWPDISRTYQIRTTHCFYYHCRTVQQTSWNWRLSKGNHTWIITTTVKTRKTKRPTIKPIILLSTLRKILASCIMSRIKSKINKKILPTQAAYCKDRSTTEHVFTCKLIADRTISAKN